MGVRSNKIKREQLKKGDHIYSWRRAFIYAHHGIYVGDGKVIHFTQAAGQKTGKGNVFDYVISSCAPTSPFPGYHCPTCGDQSGLGGVISSCLDCFLSGGDLYRFEYGVDIATFLAETRGGTCTLAFAEPEEEVLHRAFFLRANGFGDYDVFKNNCVDFAIYCKTSLLVDAKFSVSIFGRVTSLLADTSNFISSKGFSLQSLAIRCPYVMATTAGIYAVSKYFSDIGNRRDAARVAVEDLVNGRSN